METVAAFLFLYSFIGFFGCLANVIFSGLNPDRSSDKFPSGKIINWVQDNKRLSGEAKWFLAGLFCVGWAPLLALNLLGLLWLVCKVSIKGVSNIAWVISTDLIAKETKIQPAQFDEWAAQVEEFIESIPSHSELNK